jgi:hypothetical protein
VLAERRLTTGRGGEGLDTAQEALTRALGQPGADLEAPLTRPRPVWRQAGAAALPFGERPPRRRLGAANEVDARAGSPGRDRRGGPIREG